MPHRLKTCALLVLLLFLVLMCTAGSRRAAAIEFRLLLQQPSDHCKGGQRVARGEPEAGAPAGPAKLEMEVEVRGGPA